MQEVLKHLIGILILVAGFFIGNFLARITKEELVSGKKWFRIILLAALIGAIISAFFQNDFYLYTFLFILIITSKSLILRENGNRKTKC